MKQFLLDFKGNNSYSGNRIYKKGCCKWKNNGWSSVFS